MCSQAAQHCDYNIKMWMQSFPLKTYMQLQSNKQNQKTKLNKQNGHFLIESRWIVQINTLHTMETLTYMHIYIHATSILTYIHMYTHGTYPGYKVDPPPF